MSTSTLQEGFQEMSERACKIGVEANGLRGRQGEYGGGPRGECTVLGDGEQADHCDGSLGYR